MVTKGIGTLYGSGPMSIGESLQFWRGMEVQLMTRYWCRSQARADKGKGSYFLVLLGVCGEALHR